MIIIIMITMIMILMLIILMIMVVMIIIISNNNGNIIIIIIIIIMTITFPRWALRAGHGGGLLDRLARRRRPVPASGLLLLSYTILYYTILSYTILYYTILGRHSGLAQGRVGRVRAVPRAAPGLKCITYYTYNHVHSIICRYSIIYDNTND